MLDIGYGSVKKMAQAEAAFAAGPLQGPGGPEVVMGEVRFPIRWEPHSRARCPTFLIHIQRVVMGSVSHNLARELSISHSLEHE